MCMLNMSQRVTQTVQLVTVFSFQISASMCAMCMEKCVCVVVLSASLDSCPLVGVGDGTNFRQVNRSASTHTH